MKFLPGGYRCELLDGTMLVSPPPDAEHQTTVLRLGSLLDAHCPDGMAVLPAPFAFGPSNLTVLLPDVLVARNQDLAHVEIRAPLLVVEVQSPNTALNDLNTKKAAYERTGVPSYWVINPKVPSLTVFELDKPRSRYELVAEVAGDKPFEAMQPFPVRVVPAELLGRRTTAR